MSTWPSEIPPGGRLAVWAPSSPAPKLFPGRFERGLDALRTAGFETVVLPSCRAAASTATLSAEEVAAELHEALRDPDCVGVIAAVGGWTMCTVLPHIDYDLVASAAKPIVGYSDLTGLLNVIVDRANLITMHGPMVISEWGEASGPWSYTHQVFEQMTGPSRGASDIALPEAQTWSDEVLWWDSEDTRPREPRPTGERRRVLRSGTAEGRLWGGSLAALSLLLGTSWWPQPPDGALVFIEAESLAPDEFEARLFQFRAAGVFDAANGVVLSKIGNPRRTASGFADFDEVIRRVLPAEMPVAAGFELGHSTPMATLPVGAHAELSCGEAGDCAATLVVHGMRG